MMIHVRNVNEAWLVFAHMLRDDDGDKSNWRTISPRGMETREAITPVLTTYTNPQERVLFCSLRDANPFFHLFESLWILAGHNNVEFLAKFNPRMKEFSDDGSTFHAPYGFRLRHHFYTFTNDGEGENEIDQILTAVELLKKDHNTRQVVLSIWDPTYDLGTVTKDLPCNDLIFLKIRDGKLDITVSCRSNDVIWGAYGANVVQFSMLQEYIAQAVGVGVGKYNQLSDSYHVYTSNPVYQKLIAMSNGEYHEFKINNQYNQYTLGTTHHRLMERDTDHKAWLYACALFCMDPHISGLSSAKKSACETDAFFANVAYPMWAAWEQWEHAKNHLQERNRYIKRGIEILTNATAYNNDWLTAGMLWLDRRFKNG